MSYTAAQTACKDKGAVLAGYAELHTAWMSGYNVCACGWTTDRLAHRPITWQDYGNCGSGGTGPGIRHCTWQSTWDAFCYKKNAGL